ncbi:MAG: hypothetical protein MI919_41295, partial [Holophagales bacterium]|nr:hypothetical protein [Holophagales bacterium]
VLDVPDARCQECHETSHFDRDHPDFAFTADPEGDDDSIAFAHGYHVREVMEKGGWVDLERACLACHQPTADGRNFEPIDFDLHCDACHLNAGEATPRLAVAEGTGSADLGVWTLDAIRSSGLPATDWAFYMDPGELRESGRRVMKTPLHHEDPWVMWNLRHLRKMRFPDAGLADYLTTSPDLDAEGVRALYSEVVETLEVQAVGLRGSPDPGVQEQLRQIERRLEGVKRVLADPAVPLDETQLLLALSAPVELEPETAEAWDELVAGLTAPCATCHRVEDATFVRVAADQRTLVRSEFDHGAHVIQRRCLDCHGELPILEALSAPVEGEEGAAIGAAETAHDRAAIHNLPRIASCRECHRSGQVASRCVDCHLFHPDANRHSDFLLYVPEGESR